MEEIFQTLFQTVLGGGPGAVYALLLSFIGFLIWDRKRLVEDNTKKDEKIEKIIDDYYKGNLTLTETINSLKMVLIEIKGKLK